MPYKSYEELINEAKNNPKLARHRVARARKIGRPVVDEKNSGYQEEDDPKDYNSRAIAKRLSGGSNPRKLDRGRSRLESAIRNRVKRNTTDMPGASARKTESKIVTPMAEDEIVTKRKRVGY